MTEKEFDEHVEVIFAAFFDMLNSVWERERNLPDSEFETIEDLAYLMIDDLSRMMKHVIKEVSEES